MKNILLVNDDGYYAEGLQRLKAKLYPYGNVYTVAPMGGMSAKGVSITVDKKPVRYEKIDDYNYVVDGTPADCVDFAVKNLGITFDYTVSGCNRGLNLSVFSIWSGTIGACVESAYHFLPSIAFSSCINNLDTIEEYIPKVMDFILENNLLSRNLIISVNFPYSKIAKGIRLSRMSFNNGKLAFNKLDGNLYVDKQNNIDFDETDGDLYHVSHGYISVCPLSPVLFNDGLFNQIKKRFKEIDFESKKKEK